MMEIHPNSVITTPKPEKKTSQKPYKTKPFGKIRGFEEIKSDPEKSEDPRKNQDPGPRSKG